jgi:protein SCO1/2/putative membrane protein
VDLSFLPAVNAALNLVATALLVVGRMWIRRGRVAQHRRAMLAAFTVSSLFLVLYVAHKVWRGFESTPYHGEGLAQVLYLAILFSHLTLAMTVPVLALRLIQLGLGGRIERHRRLAVIAWPIWLYVSLTGVAIFLLLYVFNPAAA